MACISRTTLLLSVLVPPLIGFYLIYTLQINPSFLELNDLRAMGHLALGSLLHVFKPSLDTPVLTPHGSPVPFTRHIVAVGDLHGDLPNARRVLHFAGVTDEYGNWTGNADFFVQTGDIIDR